MTRTGHRKNRPLRGAIVGLALVLLLFPDSWHTIAHWAIIAAATAAGAALTVLVLVKPRQRR